MLSLVDFQTSIVDCINFAVDNYGEGGFHFEQVLSRWVDIEQALLSR